MYRKTLLLAVLMLAADLVAASGIDRLHHFLDGLHSMRADFEQSVATNKDERARYSKGTLYLERPGRFRWDYLDPAGQFVIADGSRVWLYDAELAQVSHQAQADALRGTPALLLSDTSPVETHFQVADLGVKEGLERVELTPKGEGSEVSRVQIAFEGERLDSFEMIDSFGQVTRFRFSHIQRNPKLEASLFRFTPPPGIDILSR